MRYLVFWTDHALSSAEDLADQLAEHSEKAAATWMRRLTERVGSLALQPRSAPPWRYATDESIRQLTVDKHVVIYRVSDAKRAVTVLAIRHGRQRPLREDELG